MSLLMHLQPVVYNTQTVADTIYAMDGSPIGTPTFDASGAIRMVSSSLRRVDSTRNDLSAPTRRRRR